MGGGWSDNNFDACVTAQRNRANVWSVTFCRSMNDVFMCVLQDDAASAAVTIAGVPNTTAVATDATRPLSRVLLTVA